MLSSAVNMGEIPKNQILQDLLVRIPAESWYGDMDVTSVNNLLSEKKIGTYLFWLDSQDTIRLSGINHHGTIEHCKIKKNDTMWLGVQGGYYIRDDVLPLIPLCLHCEADECVPLK